LNDYTICEVDVRYSPNVKFEDRPFIEGSKSSYNIALQYCDEIEFIEGFYVMLLNRANRLLGIRQVSSGGLTSTIVDVRLIFSIALKGLATSIIVFHNHPSGNVQPSDNDDAVTQKIFDAGKIMDIQLSDHLIISPHKYYCYAESGRLNTTKL
jgi:DNA repair protein RadC